MLTPFKRRGFAIDQTLQYITRRMLLTVLIAGLIAVSSQAASPQRALLDRYCVTCHTEKAKERGAVPIALDHIDASNPGTDPELWEKVIRKMRAGLMPPP